MKMFVLITLISVAALGNGFAAITKEPAKHASTVTTLADAESVYLYNVDVAYRQYRLAEARIKSSRGNHGDLDREREHFVSLYQQDIDNGVRVEQSKAAIAEIDARYAELHAERRAHESAALAKLQGHLDRAFKQEENVFEQAKRELSKTEVSTR